MERFTKGLLRAWFISPEDVMLIGDFGWAPMVSEKEARNNGRNVSAYEV